MQKLAPFELAKLEDPKATKVLVDLASDSRTPPTLLPTSKQRLRRDAREQNTCSSRWRATTTS